MSALAFPRENKNAMVRSRMPKAHGLTLSIRAAMPTRGRSHVPSALKFQSAVVPTLLVLRRMADPNRRTPTPMRTASFLRIQLGGDDGGKLKFNQSSRAI